ncbi:MAG: pyridoxal phosphate-dependent aminotransferase [Acidobacteria bacterium]|jgi:aspartate aminotransferase|nr:pyridoxal phosphate-dependent aminotransferase [Acidobacteriota bacterium]
MVELSARVKTMTSSPTLKLVQIKKQLQAQGKVILDFGAGEPDFPTPENIKNAGVEAIQKDFTKYTPTSGIAELKKAIRTAYLAEQDYEAKDAQIVVSPGSKYGLFILLQAVIDPGDEVIVPLPYWVSYPEMVKFCGGAVVFADHLKAQPAFELTAASFISRCTPRTKAVIVNSPSNPTGMVMKGEELAELIAFFHKKNILVIVDDCYRKIMYGAGKYPPPLKLVPAAHEHVAVVSSLSKTYAMTGWRLGYTIVSEALAAAMTKVQEHSTSNPCSISQKAAVEALAGDQGAVLAMVEEYRRRRDYFAKRVDEIGRIAYALPDGAFYFFADFSHYIRRKKFQDDNQLAMDILEKLNIILVPGSAFGAPDHLRISYATSMQDIRAGLDKLEAYLRHDG